MVLIYLRILGPILLRTSTINDLGHIEPTQAEIKDEQQSKRDAGVVDSQRQMSPPRR